MPRSAARAALAGALAGVALGMLDLLAVAPACRSLGQAALLWVAATGVLVPAGLLGGLVLDRVPRLPRMGGPTGLLVALALMLFFVDTRAYRRLYPGAHALLLLAEGALLWLAARQGLGPSLPRRLGLALAGLLPGLGAASYSVLRLQPEVRFLAYQETTAARQVLSALSYLVPRHHLPPPRPPARAALPQPPQVVAGTPTLHDAHVVLVTVDALRADRLRRQRAGRPLMPVLSRLADTAVSFERAYAAAPHTAFSLGSLMTGSPVRALSDLRAPLPRTLAEHLEEQGYRTKALLPDGLFFNGRRALAPYVASHFGFSQHVLHDGSAASATAAARAFVGEIRDLGEPPMLLWVHYFDPHEPYERRAELDFGSSSEDRYDGEVATVDAALGELVSALDGLLRPVLLVVTADHGEEFNDHGGYYHGSSLYEEQVRVPLLVRAPGLVPRRVDRAVGLVDVVPTLLSLLAEPPLPGVTGRDLGPLLVGADLPDAPVVSEVDTKRMVVRGWHKLIHDQLRDTWELYDLAQDPRERRNLYVLQPAIAAELTADLYDWLDSIHRQAREPVAIARGRLGDRRAAPDLAALLSDSTQPPEQRAEAARLLGALEANVGREALAGALSDAHEAVRMEAALSLGYLFDLRAVPMLEEGLLRPAYRHRAGVVLGRLRRPVAEPALLEALGSAVPLLRRQAAVYLGRVGGEAAIAPLLRARDDVHAGKDVALALGRIGARIGADRVLAPLLAWLEREERDDVVAELCHGLAELGDRRAVPALLEVLRRSPGQSWAGEALVRLGALTDPAGLVGGLDLGPETVHRTRGFSSCTRRQAASEEELGGGTCQLLGPVGQMIVSLGPPRPSYLMLLRLQPGALDLTETSLVLHINGRPLGPLSMQPGWQEVAVPVPGPLLRRGDNRIDLRLQPLPRQRGSALLIVDRVLLVPR
ncbi:MAG: sulfatase-like hydrolase/transferase [Myxococcota bacterium]|nr:sulfatase-like hydrolase/transferase [Myxococcota bacterium]